MGCRYFAFSIAIATFPTHIKHTTISRWLNGNRVPILASISLQGVFCSFGVIVDYLCNRRTKWHWRGYGTVVFCRQSCGIRVGIGLISYWCDQANSLHQVNRYTGSRLVSRFSKMLSRFNRALHKFDSI